jgi:hypothetical protein
MYRVFVWTAPGIGRESSGFPEARACQRRYPLSWDNGPYDGVWRLLAMRRILRNRI